MISLFSRDLQNNNIGTLDGPIFGGVSKVGDNLFLQNNSLTGLSADTFENVVLTYIWLSDNLLTVFPIALMPPNPERM